MSLNKAILIGKLGQDPEVRHTGSGMAVCELNLAINERRKKGESWETHTEWIRCVVFGNRAENVAKFLTKGSQVAVVGRISTEKWEKDGVTRYTTKVIADDVQFLDGKRDGGASRGGQQNSDRDHAADYGTGGKPEGLDDDIPF